MQIISNEYKAAFSLLFLAAMAGPGSILDSKYPFSRVSRLAEYPIFQTMRTIEETITSRMTIEGMEALVEDRSRAVSLVKKINVITGRKHFLEITMKDGKTYWVDVPFDKREEVYLQIVDLNLELSWISYCAG